MGVTAGTAHASGILLPPLGGIRGGDCGIDIIAENNVNHHNPNPAYAFYIIKDRPKCQG